MQEEGAGAMAFNPLDEEKKETEGRSLRKNKRQSSNALRRDKISAAESETPD